MSREQKEESTLHVFGYPRSGNHYLLELLKANELGAFSKSKYGQWASAHSWPPPFSGELFENIFKRDNRIFYIWRGFEEVGPSLLSMAAGTGRMRDGIQLQHFISTPWNALIKAGDVESKLLNRWVTKEQRSMTPYECWESSRDSWLSFAETRTDVFVVKYEDLMGSFTNTMSSLAQWLDVDRDAFENVTKKVDPGPVRKGGFREV